MRSERRVVITGVGVISPVGSGKENFWQGVMSGRSGISEIEAFDTSGYRTHRGGEVKDFDPLDYMDRERAESIGRASQFAIATARMALEDAGLELSNLEAERTGVSCGTTMGESQVIEVIDDVLVREGFDKLTRD